MIDQAEPQGQRRRPIARIGICLLNLLAPGLGLIRLARYRWGFGLLALAYLSIAFLLGSFAVIGQMTFRLYIGLAAVSLATMLLVYVAALVLSWRWSAQIILRRGWLWRWYGVAGLTVLLGLLTPTSPNILRSQYRTFDAPSDSMAPSIETGDVFLAKMRDFVPVQRGDVIIVKKGAVDYVKRVAGIPGDTISMQHGNVMLNGRLIDLVPEGSEQRIEGDVSLTAQRYREIFPGEKIAHQILDLGTRPQDDTPPVTLGEDQYFVLGDNRDNSLDSRFPQAVDGVGIVTSDRIKGRVLFRIWRKGVGLTDGRI